MEMNGKNQQNMPDIERGQQHQQNIEESKLVNEEPRRASFITINTPQPDYYNWSTASLFVCFIWGIFAFRASNKVRKYNKMKAYNDAAYYSKEALRHNQSAVACFVVLLLIVGLPLAISLAVQGSITKYPSAREFFG